MSFIRLKELKFSIINLKIEIIVTNLTLCRKMLYNGTDLNGYII